MNKVLVTGGAGFIGSHLVDLLLKEGKEVVVIDNLSQGNKLSRQALKNIDLSIGDVQDFQLLNRAAKGCVQIYHLAALLGVDVVAKNHVKTMDVEAISMRNIVRVSNNHNVEKIIYASTSGVYGKADFDMIINEDFNVSPSTSYAMAKRFNEIYLKSLWIEQGISSVSIRYFNAFGPRQDERMVVPRFINQAKSNSPITVFGTGEQTRDFTYVIDAARVTIMLAEQTPPGCEIYNVCGKNEISIIKVAKKIKEFVNSNSEIKLLDTPKNRIEFEVERRSGNTAKLEQYLGKQSFLSFENGLKEILQA